MANFHLEINLDSESMQTPRELVDAIRRTADAILMRAYEFPFRTLDHGPIRDSTGILVGEWWRDNA